jgi:hypothetical protein
VHRTHAHCKHFWHLSASTDFEATATATRMVIQLPADLIEDVRSLSSKEAVSMSAIIEYALECFLET